MKTVLCYGDSLTYGANAETGGRHLFEDRWPSVLGAELGTDKVRVIAEGLGGRTTAFDDFSTAADRNGVRILPTLLASHHPLDCVVIMLGTNDLKPFISGSAIGAAKGMKRLCEIVRECALSAGDKIPELVIVSPPHCCETDHIDLNAMLSSAGGITESKEFAYHYKRVAEELDCAYFDAATVAQATPLDGVHLDAASTRAIGIALAPIIKSVLRF